MHVCKMWYKCLMRTSLYRTAIMDAHLDPSDILNLFTGKVWSDAQAAVRCTSCKLLRMSFVVADLAEKRAIDGNNTIRIAQQTIHALQSDLTRKDC